MMRRFWPINAVLFQLAWFAAALLTEYAAGIILSLLVLHFYLSPCRKTDSKLLLLAPIGWLTDILLIQYGVFYADQTQWPLWLALLWAMFAISLNHSLKWTMNIAPLWLVLIGAVAGTSSYLAAINFNALFSSLPTQLLIVYLATTWALLLPLMVILGQKLCLMSPKTFKAKTHH